MNSSIPSIPSDPVFEQRAIGRRLRSLIETQYPNISEFARQAGITRCTLTRIFSGKVLPSPQTLACVCRQLGCSMDFLLGVSCPESDSAEGFETALVNVHAFRSEWSRARRLFLAFAVIGSLNEKEEQKLSAFLGLEKSGQPP